MAEKEYIEREALEKEIDEAQNSLISNDDRIWRMNGKYFKGLAWARRLLLDAPASDVVEVKYGTWKLHKNGSGTCDQCHFTQRGVWDYDNWQRYCGVCGARMDNIKCED